jgi:hypothetical protein
VHINNTKPKGLNHELMAMQQKNSPFTMRLESDETQLKASKARSQYACKKRKRA